MKSKIETLEFTIQELEEALWKYRIKGDVIKIAETREKLKWHKQDLKKLKEQSDE